MWYSGKDAYGDIQLFHLETGNQVCIYTSVDRNDKAHHSVVLKIPTSTLPKQLYEASREACVAQILDIRTELTRNSQVTHGW